MRQAERTEMMHQGTKHDTDQPGYFRGSPAAQLRAGASDRQTWRVGGGFAKQFGASSVVVAQYNELSRPGLVSFLGARERLAAAGLRVPLVYASDAVAGYVVEEDLGELSFEVWLTEDPPQDLVTARYRSVLEQAALAHALRDEEFWQRPYDRGQQLVDVGQIYRFDFDFHVSSLLFASYLGRQPAGVEAERFAELVQTVSAHLAGAMRGVMLRDLQSSNILLTGPLLEPAFIDFQDARWGVPEYDVAALAWDSYTPFSESQRRELAALYPGAHSIHTLDYAIIQRKLHDAGAFAGAFRSQGKMWFIKWIGAALQMALTALERCPELPDISGFLQDCMAKATD